MERCLLEATVGINISRTEFGLSAVEKLFRVPWIYQGITAKQICEKYGGGALYQGKGIVTKQVSASTVEVKISGDEIKTYHVNDLLFLIATAYAYQVYPVELFSGKGIVLGRSGCQPDMMICEYDF